MPPRDSLAALTRRALTRSPVAGPSVVDGADRELLIGLGEQLLAVLGHPGYARFVRGEVVKLRDDQVAEALRMLRARLGARP